MQDVSTVESHGSIKVILSATFGLGWSSLYESDPDVQLWMLTYQPIIDAIEGRLDMKVAMDRFAKDFMARFGQRHLVHQRSEFLEVQTVSEAFIVREYDGAEWIELVREIRAFDQNGVCKLEPSK
ncbi:hypothetical protein [Acetobacter persici]|uniref:Uncharacterized protein n=1 Tax=Acetobacter persici TaxID=1076596 RepID=A0A6V8IB54_9PROT|nr:hypothetical protein [Acetobacter persici]GFE94820.1 hypothetical protein DmAi_28790 [Acetobacter persici]